MARLNKHCLRTGALIGSIALVLTLGLSGCNQYFDRQEAITLGVGDAVAQNKAAHTIHPWPAGSRDPKHATNGARALIAVRRYENNDSIEPEAISSQKVSSADK